MSAPDWKLEIEPRLCPDGRQLFGEPEFREALGYIGHRLGLCGSFTLVGDVVGRFDKFMDTKPEDFGRILSALESAEWNARRAMQYVPGFQREINRALKALHKGGYKQDG